MSESLFGWIHVSDIHFGHGDAGHGWDQELVMATLRRDIAARPVDVPIDAILVTGDIAFSGAGRSPDEYARAHKWLLELARTVNLGPERIFVVPGNHDVNRGVDARNRSAGRLLEALRSRAVPKQGIDDALRDPDDRKLLASRMAAFLEFAKDFGPWVSREGELPEQRLHWVHGPLEGKGGLRVRLVGLNTALLSKDDEDFGQLRLGNEQLAKAFVEDHANEVVLVLSHHPLKKGWLADEGHADAMLRQNAHAHLSGHVHGAESEEARAGSGGSFVRVTAGAAHNDQLPPGIPQSHGYNFGEIRRDDAGKVVLRVHPRLWSSARFVVDVHSVPDGATFAEHTLALKLAAEEPRKGVVAPKATPRAELPRRPPFPAFVSYAAADERLAKSLTRRLESDPFIDLSAARVDDARIVLLLVSPDYVASTPSSSDDVKAAVKHHELGQARVLPILVRACSYRALPFGHLPFALERGSSVPSASWSDAEIERIQEALHDAVAELVLALE
jgi:hypothetical protein